MGWKSFMIVVKPAADFDREALIKGLGMGHEALLEGSGGLVPTGEATLEVAIYPQDDITYIGQYQDCLIICDAMLAPLCLTDEVSPEEAFLMQTFSQAEIGVFVLQSTVNFWGYALLAHGQKIRARAGSSDDGTFLDFGPAVSQEMALLAKSTLGADGQRTYTDEFDPEEPMTEDQMGEEFVFELSARFFGKRIDHADDLLFETKLQAYGSPPQPTAAKSKTTAPPPQQRPSQSPPAPKPWWKFW